MDVSGSFEAGEVPSDAICVDDAESTDEFETQLENAVAEGGCRGAFECGYGVLRPRPDRTADEETGPTSNGQLW